MTLSQSKLHFSPHDSKCAVGGDSAPDPVREPLYDLRLLLFYCKGLKVLRARFLFLISPLICKTQPEWLQCWTFH